jgi:hypothetical protein
MNTMDSGFTTAASIGGTPGMGATIGAGSVIGGHLNTHGMGGMGGPGMGMAGMGMGGMGMGGPGMGASVGTAPPIAPGQGGNHGNGILKVKHSEYTIKDHDDTKILIMSNDNFKCSFKYY